MLHTWTRGAAAAKGEKTREQETCGTVATLGRNVLLHSKKGRDTTMEKVATITNLMRERKPRPQLRRLQ